MNALFRLQGGQPVGRVARRSVQRISLTLYAKVYPLFDVLPLLILPLRKCSTLNLDLIPEPRRIGRPTGVIWSTYLRLLSAAAAASIDGHDAADFVGGAKFEKCYKPRIGQLSEIDAALAAQCSGLLTR